MVWCLKHGIGLLIASGCIIGLIFGPDSHLVFAVWYLLLALHFLWWVWLTFEAICWKNWFYLCSIWICHAVFVVVCLFSKGLQQCVLLVILVGVFWFLEYGLLETGWATQYEWIWFILWGWFVFLSSLWPFLSWKLFDEIVVARFVIVVVVDSVLSVHYCGLMEFGWSSWGCRLSYVSYLGFWLVFGAAYSTNSVLSD